VTNNWPMSHTRITISKASQILPISIGGGCHGAFAMCPMRKFSPTGAKIMSLMKVRRALCGVTNALGTLSQLPVR